MAKPVKGGYLLRHRKRLFGKAWREEWVVLYEDSTLAWYKEKGKGEPEGSVVVKEAPEMLAVSEWTLRIPGRPELPSGCQVVQLMAFGTRNGDKVHWLLAQSEEEVNGWMTAISNTLPPPPQPPDEKEGKINSERLDTVNPRLPPVSQHTPLPGEVPPAINNSAGPEYPQNSYMQGAGMTQPIICNNTMNSGGGDLMTGLLLGAALSNWGHGLGWVSMPPAYTATTVNTVVNNHYDTTHTATYDTYTSFDDGDYGMDCSGDFGF